MTNNDLTFPAFAGDVIESLIAQGYDAHDALRACTLINGSAWIGHKVTMTAYRKIVAYLDAL